MKVIFCSSVYNMEDYDEIARRSTVHASLADHNLNSNVILGLEENLGTAVTLVNNVQIPNYPKFDKILFHRQPWQHREGAEDINCGFINLPVIKHLSRAVTTYRELKKLLKKEKDEEIFVISYDLHLGISLALGWAKKRFPRITTCAFLPDIPSAVVAASNDGKISLGGKLRAAVKERFIRQFDSYVFITEHIASLPVVAGKPYAVVEGIFNNHQPPLAEKTMDEKIIFYSGQLNPAYGMENLLQAFQRIYAEDQSYRLWLCGGGGLSEEIRALEKKCAGVKYFGYVSGSRVRQLQAEATVLVNPRQNVGALTRYSFPSKTMEYLASGRPVVGYQLDGIPREYDDYINFVPSNSVEDLAKTLTEICEKSAEERNEIGQRAREFILKEKNPKAMCLGILEMWRKMPKSGK